MRRNFLSGFICSGWAASAAIMTGMFLTLIRFDGI